MVSRVRATCPSSHHHVDSLLWLSEGANSAEFDSNTEHPVIIFMPEISKTHMGVTMRLGLRPTIFDAAAPWSQVRGLYGDAPKIWERHRHRYEVNPAYIDRLQAKGMRFVGTDEKGERMQVFELPGACELLYPVIPHVAHIPVIRSRLLCRPPGAPRVLHAPP